MSENSNKKLSVSIIDAAQLTSLSRSTLIGAIDAGNLPVRRFGNRTLILMRDLELFIESLPTDRPHSPTQLKDPSTFKRPRGRPPNGMRSVGKIELKP